MLIHYSSCIFLHFRCHHAGRLLQPSAAAAGEPGAQLRPHPVDRLYVMEGPVRGDGLAVAHRGGAVGLDGARFSAR